MLDWRSRPTKLFIETKHPVRFGSLVESEGTRRTAAIRYRLAASAAHSRAVVMSFSAAAVWRIRRSAPLLPTVLLGESSRFLGGGAATTVGATAVGPSVKTLREHPELVDKAAAAGRATYCWTVDDADDVKLCRKLGVGWVATNYPGRTKALLADWRACRFAVVAKKSKRNMSEARRQPRATARRASGGARACGRGTGATVRGVCRGVRSWSRCASSSRPRRRRCLARHAGFDTVADSTLRGFARQVVLGTVLPTCGGGPGAGIDRLRRAAVAGPHRRSRPRPRLRDPMGVEPSNRTRRSCRCAPRNTTPGWPTSSIRAHTLDITVHNDFAWWIPEGVEPSAEERAAVQRAKAVIIRRHGSTAHSRHGGSTRARRRICVGCARRTRTR